MEAPSDPRNRPDQALATALLPVLLHRIRNTTQLVTGVNAVLAYETEGGPLPEARAEDLAQAAREADELGWLLAVLSGGLGADLAGQRREPGGLRATLELLREALRRAGGTLGLATPAAPTLAAGAPAAALCLTLAELCWNSLGGAPEGTPAGAPSPELGFERTDAGWQVWLRGGKASGPAQPQRLTGARLQADASGWCLELPSAWLE